MDAVHELEAAIGAVVQERGPSVVGLGRGWGVGSGVVVADGRILTSAHNLRDGQAEKSVTFSDGRTGPARVLGVDLEGDLAVLVADTGGATPVPWPDDAGAAPPHGRFVIALANPGGRGLCAAPGFVTGAPRSFRGPRGRRIMGAIEHTAPLPRGSSGGPLLSAEGTLLGINTVRLEGGLILALAAGTAMRGRVEALSRGEPPVRRRLGVAVAPPRVARRMRRAVGLPEREGVLVRVVENESLAARAGIERGDLIVEAGGRTVEATEVLCEALEAASGEVELTIVRGVQERPVKVVFDP